MLKYIYLVIYPSKVTLSKIFVFICKYFHMCYNNCTRGKILMKTYSSREVIKILKADGRYEVMLQEAITSTSIHIKRAVLL